MDSRGKSHLLAVLVSVLSVCFAGSAVGQLSFYDDWNIGWEWSEYFQPGVCMKGFVNEHMYCGHWNDYPEGYNPACRAPCDPDGPRAGIWRAISHHTLSGPPNVAWAWHIVNVSPYYNYRLTFQCAGDVAEVTPGTKWFSAFGYTKDMSATYTGSGWVLGGGLPNGFVGAPGVSDWVSAGGDVVGWGDFSLDFDTGDGTTQIKLWGIVQNIDATDTDIYLTMLIDCVSVSPLGAIEPTPTPLPTYPPSTNADGWEVYR